MEVAVPMRFGAINSQLDVGVCENVIDRHFLVPARRLRATDQDESEVAVLAW